VIRTRKFVAFTLRYARVLWLAAFVLAIPAFVRMASVYRHLRSELDQLLPPNAPSVAAIRELRARMPGLQHLGVIVDTGQPENVAAAERFLDDLEVRVRAYPPELVRSVRTGIHAERDFVEKHAPLYLELADLQLVRQRIEARKEWEASKAFGSNLDDEESKEPSLDFKDLEDKYKTKQSSSTRFPNSRFSNAEQHVTLLLIELGGLDTGTAKPRELLDRVKADIAALGGPEKYAPGMRLGFTGDVAINVEELSALVSDLTLSSLLVIAAVVLVILLFYKWWASIPILMVPLLLGTAYSFGLVTLPPLSIRELNSNTAFLGSIIVGNGINFGIILLARYVEVRRRGVAVEEALVTAVWGARVGTLTAALAAGTAYASLIITDFRGFRQFGVIGGVGMVVCWGTAFLLTPSLIRFFDRGDALTEQRAPRRNLMRPIAALVQRAPRAIVIGAAVITLLSLGQLRKFGRDRFEFDFSKLRRADTFVHGEGYWGRKMDRLLGRYLSPTVFLTNSPSEAAMLAQNLREATKRPPLDEITANVATVDDVVPRDQPEKLAEVKAIRALMTPTVRARVPEQYKKFVDDILGPEQLEPIAPAALPAVFTTGMRERDGTLNRAVLLYPKPSPALWNGDRLLGLAAAERAVAEQTGGVPARVAGSLLLSADIIDAVQRDGLKATLAALGGVIVIVLLLFRRSSATFFVVGSLIVAVVWLAALTMISGVKLNFANFIAFPITFGIGVDYSVNVMARYRQDGTGDVSGAIASTGGAVGLCSLTTIIGYSSLLVAENRALFSFGAIAVLGEIACLITAVVVLPALLLVVRRPASQEARVVSAE